jgi:response regulator of citrate/malate metabolism
VISTLIVDDDYRVSRIHAAYVAAVEGFRVVGEAHTLREASASIEALKPDLVLLDVYLPDGSGLDLLSQFPAGEDRPDCIVITAARDVSTVRTAMQLGAVHFLVKPFSAAALKERLVSYRDLHRQLGSLSEEPDQAEVDRLFRTLRGPDQLPPTLRKGHSAPTLELVRSAVRQAAEPISAADIAEQVGISRPTAQRYLAYLAEHGLVRLELRYGGTGRPEHLYAPAAPR